MASVNNHIPPDLWEECPSCRQLLYAKQLANEQWVCPRCGHHLRLSVWRRLQIISDPGSFQPWDDDLPLVDPLNFPDYQAKVERARKRTQMNEAVLTGQATLNGIALGVGIMDLSFIGGSMGWVVGERITRLLERCADQQLPVVIFCASGGARMQESLVSLMQMPKTAAAAGKLREASVPYISVITHPTYGGVTASYSFLGDIIIAEPQAAVGFAGPRVVEVTGVEMRPDVQRAEFQYEHGMIDLIVNRRDMRRTIHTLLCWFQGIRPPTANGQDGKPAMVRELDE